MNTTELPGFNGGEKDAPSSHNLPRVFVSSSQTHLSAIQDTTERSSWSPRTYVSSNYQRHLDYLHGIWHRKPSDDVAKISTPTLTERIYPQIFDKSERAGKAIELIGKIGKDVQAALEAYDDGDFGSLNHSLTLIAASAAEAFTLSEFNESFSAVVAFIRRAVLATSASEITRPSLNALSQGISRLKINPMLDLEAAADIVIALTDTGWTGEHAHVEKLVKELLAAEENEIQAAQEIGG